jgi:ribonucleoside-diphosphate reductase alpha chain/ribonucleoside-triphosphate reductase
MLLTDKFIESYSEKDPFPSNGLGSFIYLRTYSRWLDELRRREYWHETVRRVVEESFERYTGHKDQEVLRTEAQSLYDDVFNFRVFPSGRSLWVAGTQSSKDYGESNYNCAHLVIDNLDAYPDMFFLLMVGTGVGFRVLSEDVKQLPKMRTDVKISHIPYVPCDKHHRLEQTTVSASKGGGSLIHVGDSKEGWVEALRYTLAGLTEGSSGNKIEIEYNSVRPEGERLMTFGGRASGPGAVQSMFTKIHKVVNETNDGVLTSVDALDISNIIAEGVVCGGVRRSAQIALGDSSDTAFITAKEHYYEKPDKLHRAMSNNSIFFKERPSFDKLLEIAESIKINGEPGFVNSEAAQDKRPWFAGINPCAEILLSDKGLCNLTTVNVRNHVVEGKKAIDMEQLEKSLRQAVRVGARMTNIDLYMQEWDDIQKRDRLLGVSLTGWMDMIDLTSTGYSEDIRCYYNPGPSGQQTLFDSSMSPSILLTLMNSWANSEAQDYANELRMPKPLLVTCVKPEGTLSQLPGVSSGIHRTWSKYYIRRVRISSSDPLAYTMLYSGFSVFPENGEWKSGPQDPIKAEEAFKELGYEQRVEALKEASTWVVEFPVESDAAMNANDEPALKQLERYFLFQNTYTDHNTSITVYVGEDEWEPVMKEIYDNWNDYIAIAFLPRQSEKRMYALPPYESIDQAEFHTRTQEVSFDRDVLDMIEQQEWDGELLDSIECASGVCPVR